MPDDFFKVIKQILSHPCLKPINHFPLLLEWNLNSCPWLQGCAHSGPAHFSNLPAATPCPAQTLPMLLTSFPDVMRHFIHTHTPGNHLFLFPENHIILVKQNLPRETCASHARSVHLCFPFIAFFRKQNFFVYIPVYLFAPFMH